MSSTDINDKSHYKRPFDLIVLSVASLLLLPPLIVLWLLIPLAIWLGDRGPVLFRQMRMGKDGKEFEMLKFRTMVSGADAERLWTADNDSRVTRVGSILRRTALDELPQWFNILQGNLSFVGPRALPVQMHLEAAKIEPRFHERLQVTPGLTGVAQLYLPRHCPARRRLRYDLLYIKKASLWLDVRLILWATWYALTGRWGTGRLSPVAPTESEP